ncbi:ABC-three component system protein [Brevibacillus centrosporus]|uniref:ABC-three component system protein n=1 Tax=Brevibacillus centrosporus TaxID=54910 RepID=UPI003D1B616E
MPDQFSAGSSALGYLFQARFSLHLILQKMDSELSIERLDDVAFEDNGAPIELLQLKHHIHSSANLTDGSADLWKTIRVWSEAVKSKKISLPDVVLSLVTTSSAPDGSIASLLREDDNRDPKEAYDRLLAYTDTSESKSNNPAYQAFLSLPHEQRLQLVECIYVVDQCATILEAEGLVKKQLTVAIHPRYLNALYERLEGWWLQRVIGHLATDSNGSIRFSEVNEKINEIRDQLRTDSLPIDYQHEDPPQAKLGEDKRPFVQHLQVISLSNPRIDHAIRDFYRASKQRSRWVKDELVSITELYNYDRLLKEAWEELFAIVNEDLAEDAHESLLQENGKTLYTQIIQIRHLNIRRDCTEPYVMKGSFHILANKIPIELGWHPYFFDKIIFQECVQDEEGII